MNESTVVSVECLDVRGLGFDRSDAASSFVLQMSLVQKSGKCVSHKTSPLPLGDGRMRSFMEPRTAGKRQVLTTEEVLDDDVAVRFEVLERRSPRRPSSRFSSSPPRPVTTVVGTVEVVPWLATTSGPSHRWLRLQDASGRKLRTELRARATVLLGTGNALSDVHAVVDDMTWFRQNVCTKPKNVVKVAVVRSRKPFSNQRPCFVEVTSSAAARGGGQDQEEEERGTILLKSCARTAPSASGLFLEVLTVKLEESIRIRVVDTQGVAPGDVTLRVNDLSETPQWLQAGPLGLLVAARRDYDEQCDDYAGRPFFDDDEVLDVSEKTRPPPNVLRVVVARARGPYFAAAAEKSSFTATVRVGADELSTRAVPSTAEACVWDECFEFPFPKTTKTTTTTTEEDTARRVSVASTVEKLSRRPKSLLPGVDSDDDDSDDDDTASSLAVVKKTDPATVTVTIRDHKGEVARFAVDTSTFPDHVVMKQWYAKDDPVSLLLGTKACYEPSWEAGESRDLKFTQLKIAFPEVSEDVISKVLDSTGDVEDACAALGTLVAGDDGAAAFANATDLRWGSSFSSQPSHAGNYYGLVLDDDLLDDDLRPVGDGAVYLDDDHRGSVRFREFEDIDDEQQGESRRTKDDDDDDVPPPPPVRDYEIPTRPVKLIRMATLASVLDSQDYFEVAKKADIDAIASISIAKADPDEYERCVLSSTAQALTSRRPSKSGVVGNPMQQHDMRRPSRRGSSCSETVQSHSSDGEDDDDPRQQRRLHRFTVRVRSTFQDATQSVDRKFAQTAFEFAQLQVETFRAPRDFVMLREGLCARLGVDDVPELPEWVTRALQIKKKASNVASVAGAATLSIATALAVVTGTAPFIAVAGSVALAAAATGGTRQLTIARADVDPDCTWLQDVRNYLAASPASPHAKKSATTFLKLFLVHSGRCRVYQQPRRSLSRPSQSS